MNDTFLKIESISLAVFAIGSLLFIIVIVVSSAISAKRGEKKFQKSARGILGSEAELKNMVESFREIFTTYSTSMGCYLTIIQLIERLITNFHDPKHQLPPEKNELQIARLREILKTFKEELIYNDEKLNAVINQLENDNLKNEIKSLFRCINSYNDGRLFEKDQEISKLKNKMKKDKKLKIISFFFGLIGFISSVITIVNFVGLK